jgi:hypothetical protein
MHFHLRVQILPEVLLLEGGVITGPGPAGQAGPF